MTYDPITIAITLCALLACGWLCYKDIKLYLLPNIGVLILALLGIAFHALNPTYILSLTSILAGFFVGGAFLLLIRWGANSYYKQDTMGMGDVKLMMAGGIWVGFPNILVALSIGAFAGAIIGVCSHTISNARKPAHEKQPLNQQKIAAGPGFIVGLIITAMLLHMKLV